jgi:hypothetical protein
MSITEYQDLMIENLLGLFGDDGILFSGYSDNQSHIGDLMATANALKQYIRTVGQDGKGCKFNMDSSISLSLDKINKIVENYEHPIKGYVLPPVRLKKEFKGMPIDEKIQEITLWVDSAHRKKSYLKTAVGLISIEVMENYNFWKITGKLFNTRNIEKHLSTGRVVRKEFPVDYLYSPVHELTAQLLEKEMKKNRRLRGMIESEVVSAGVSSLSEYLHISVHWRHGTAFRWLFTLFQSIYGDDKVNPKKLSRKYKFVLNPTFNYYNDKSLTDMYEDSSVDDLQSTIQDILGEDWTTQEEYYSRYNNDGVIVSFDRYRHGQLDRELF